MLGNSLIGDNQIGQSEIGSLAPLYFTATDTVTKSDTNFSIALTVATFIEHITKHETKSATVTAIASDTITKHDRQSALVNGSPVSLLWTHVAKVITTLWTKIRKP